MKINAFLIGVQKAGTSTFWNWLSQHPDIYAPEVMKDFHFFTRPEWRNKGYKYLHSFYCNYNNEDIVLHGGVNYYFEEEFLRYALEYQPDGKFILILRDPIDRAWSAYRYFAKLGIEKRDFEKALNDELENKNHLEDRHMYAYIEHGLYAKHLKAILSRIHSQNILILSYKELFKNPDIELKKTFRFLGVEENFTVDTSIIKNSTGQVRFSWLNEMLYSKKGVVGAVKRYVPVQKLIPLEWRIRLGNSVRDINVVQKSSKPIMLEVHRSFLTDIFKQDQADLKKLLTEHGLFDNKHV